MTTHHKLQYDPKALAVARAVHDAIRPETVILFGSRARDDYGLDSDIDLLVITGEHGMSNAAYMKAQNAALRQTIIAYGEFMNVDVVRMTPAEYQRCRRGINHVAGQATRDGVMMTGERPHCDHPNPDAGPIDWPDVQQRAITSDRNLGDLEKALAIRQSQEIIGFLAQQTLETILKGWLSALGVGYRNSHNLDWLMGLVRQQPGEAETPAGAELAWLGKYAVADRYEGARVRMDDPMELYHGIERAVAAIRQRIMELTGADDLPRYIGFPDTQ